MFAEGTCVHRGVRICRAAESGAQRSNFDTAVRVDADTVAISEQGIDTCIYIAIKNKCRYYIYIGKKLLLIKNNNLFIKQWKDYDLKYNFLLKY